MAERHDRARHRRACDHAPTLPKDRERPVRAGSKSRPPEVERAGDRDCHLGGDFLMIHKTDDATGKGGIIVFFRARTHSELFQE